MTAPALCIEILSPEDTLTRTMERAEDYLSMGVPVCWVIDPVAGDGWVATPGRFGEASGGVLRADGIGMPLADILE